MPVARLGAGLGGESSRGNGCDEKMTGH
jgi:hypothetical protein